MKAIKLFITVLIVIGILFTISLTVIAAQSQCPGCPRLVSSTTCGNEVSRNNPGTCGMHSPCTVTNSNWNVIFSCPAANHANNQVRTWAATTHLHGWFHTSTGSIQTFSHTP